ncbi:MAG: DUF4340 domain-containing protein [Nitrospira sp.]|nr:DUF4340 domain-containing protein [Nitrospira sp.]
MRYWSSILMAVILAGLGAYLYFVELPAQQQEETQRSQAKQLLPFSDSAITGLAITTSQGVVHLTKTDSGTWVMTAPLQTDADSREVEALLRALVTGTVSRTVADRSAPLAPFGLDQPITTVTVTASSQQETLAIGDSGPLSNTLYVLRESDGAVLLTDLAPKDFIGKSLMTFRRKEILRVAQNEIDRVRLTYPSTEIVLYNMAQDKSRPSWKIRYPIEAEADQTEVRSLLFRLEDLKALSIIDPGPERDTIAKRLTTPHVKVTIHTPAGDQTVRFYQPDSQSGEAIAEVTPDGPLYRVTPSIIKGLTKDLFDLQDKRLLGANVEDIAILSVKARDRSYVLINQQGEWVLEDQPERKLRQEIADLFVSRVVNLQADARVVKQATALAPYGLLEPRAEFVATGKDGRLAGKLALGNLSGNLVYATGHRLSGIYQVRSDILTQIPSKAELLGDSQETAPR